MHAEKEGPLNEVRTHPAEVRRVPKLVQGIPALGCPDWAKITVGGGGFQRDPLNCFRKSLPLTKTPIESPGRGVISLANADKVY